MINLAQLDCWTCARMMMMTMRYKWNELYHNTLYYTGCKVSATVAAIGAFATARREQIDSYKYTTIKRISRG